MRVRFLFPFLLIGLLMIGAWIGYSRYTSKKELASLYSAVPLVQLVTLDNKIVDLRVEAFNYPSVLIYFNSSCPICQSEAELIERNFKKDTLTQFLWVSSESVEEIKEFSALYKLDSLSSHHFYSDTLYSLANAFKLTGVPATFIYDAEGDLVDYALGAVSISDLMLSIQKAHDRSR
jgi:thiol-disulfide isomerase/thioredoxin